MMQTRLRRRDLLLATAGLASTTVTGCLDGSRREPEVVGLESGEEVVFEGHASGWLGVEPAAIEDAVNPTLELEREGEYVFEWVNADGARHDLQIQGDDGDVVDGLVSERLDTVDETASLEFTASPEMTQYVCSFHRSSQSGVLRVE